MIPSASLHLKPSSKAWSLNHVFCVYLIGKGFQALVNYLYYAVALLLGLNQQPRTKVDLQVSRGGVGLRKEVGLKLLFDND